MEFPIKGILPPYSNSRLFLTANVYSRILLP
jgi:hypothetical protein